MITNDYLLIIESKEPPNIKQGLVTVIYSYIVLPVQTDSDLCNSSIRGRG